MRTIFLLFLIIVGRCLILYGFLCFLSKTGNEAIMAVFWDNRKHMKMLLSNANYLRLFRLKEVFVCFVWIILCDIFRIIMFYALSRHAFYFGEEIIGWLMVVIVISESLGAIVHCGIFLMKCFFIRKHYLGSTKNFS